MTMWAHPARRGKTWTPKPPPEPEQEIIVSQCFWCDDCQSACSDLDPDFRSMQMNIPRMENGVKIGMVGVERHRCGSCTRQAEQVFQRRAAISAGAQDAEDKLKDALAAADDYNAKEKCCGGACGSGC